MNRKRIKIQKFIQYLQWRRAFSMLEKTPAFDEMIRVIEEGDDDDRFSRIRCPACQWRPEAASRWTCFDFYQTEHPTGGCWTEWNTFDTRGRCPGCSHQWIRTTCLRCSVHSLHEDWYENGE